MDQAESLIEKLVKILDDALQRGFKLPFHLAVVGENGSLQFVRYTSSDAGEGLDGAKLAGYHPTPEDPQQLMTLPINIMLVDARGRSGHIRMDVDNRQTSQWN